PLPAGWFLAGRLVWGVGSSFLFVGAMASVLALSAGAERGRLVARVRSAVSLGMPGGLVVGGLVTSFATAGAAFWLATGFSLLAGLAAWLGIPARSSPGRHAEVSGSPDNGAWRQLLANRGLVAVCVCAAVVAFGALGVLLVTLVVLVQQRSLLVP